MQCDGCTFCCRALDVPWMGKRAGERCRHQADGVGCNLWPDIPDQCMAYECSYRRADKCSTDLCPSSCGVAFERVAGRDIMVGTMLDNSVAHSEVVIGQVRTFRRLGMSVVLWSRGFRQIIPAPGVSAATVACSLETLAASL